MDVRKRVLKYNAINLFAVFVFPIIILIILIITLWMLKYEIENFGYLIGGDDDLLEYIMLGPALAFSLIISMIGTVKINRKQMLKYIHDKNQAHYVANNINIDHEEDSGSLTQKEKAFLPQCTGKYRSTSIFEFQADGEFKDLGVKYTVDSFCYSIIDTQNQSGKEYLKFTGEVLNLKFTDLSFSNKEIIYMTKDIERFASGFQFRRFQAFESKLGKIFYPPFIYPRIIQKFMFLIESELIADKEDIMLYVVFINNQILIFMDDKSSNSKIKLPFVIHKNKIDSLITNQKRKMYKFNMFVNKISTMFYS